MRTAPSRFGTAIVVVTALTLGGLLSACGSSSKSSTKTTKTTSSAAGQSTTTQAASDVVVTVKKDPKLGNVLADSKGLTLYTLTSNGKAVPCTGPCLAVWPPLSPTAGSTTPKGSAGVTGLTAVKGPDGTDLVAINGLPLYTFVKDKDAEDAYGEGISSFGGVWHTSQTMAAASPKATAEESTTSEATTTTSGNGY